MKLRHAAALAVAVFVLWTALVIEGRHNVKYAQTRAQIEDLREALRRYHVDTGYYPTTDQGLLALVGYYVMGGSDPLDPGIVRPRLPPAHAPTDAWGNPFFYKSDGTSYVLKSLGPSGTLGENASELETHAP